MKLFVMGLGLLAGMIAASIMAMCLTFINLIDHYQGVMDPHVGSLEGTHPEVFFGMSYRDPILDVKAQQKFKDMYLQTKIAALQFIWEILVTNPKKCDNEYQQVYKMKYILGVYERKLHIYDKLNPYLSITVKLCVLEMVAAVVLMYGMEKNHHSCLWPWFLVNCSYLVASIILAGMCFFHKIVILGFVVSLVLIPFRIFTGMAVGYAYLELKHQYDNARS